MIDASKARAVVGHVSRRHARPGLSLKFRARNEKRRRTMARSKAKSYKAPYGMKGDLQHYPTPWWTANLSTGEREYHEPEWRTPEPMRAVLVYEGYGRGRTAVYFMWRHAITGTRYPMFIVDFDAMMRARTIPLQGVLATWIECKRGSNYGIRIATSAEIEAHREGEQYAAVS